MPLAERRSAQPAGSPPAPGASPAGRVSAACGQLTPAARRPAPDPSAPGCYGLAGPKTGYGRTHGRCPSRTGPWRPGS